MRRLHLLLAVLLMTGIGLFGFITLASAYSFHSGNNVTLSQKTIYDSVYMAGRTVDINNTVYGDVFCAGQNVNVTGTVHGDVICAGQTVNVTGKVDGDVRLAGQNVTLGANVSGNATIGGQSFTLTSSGKVGGDLTAGSADTTLNGAVGRDAVLGGTTVTVNNTVGRNIKAQADTMKLTANARVGGNIALTSQHALSQDKGAVVTGTVSLTKPSETSKPRHAAPFGFGFIWFIYWFVAMLVTAIVLTLLFPRLFHSVTNQAMPRPWKALLIGFLATIAAPIIIVLSAASIIGLPLALLAGLAWLVVLLLSGPAFGYYLGRLILRGTRSPLLFMLVGAAVLVVLYFIPIVGILAVLAAMWIGTGMLLLALFRRTPRPSYRRLPAFDSKS